MAQAQLTWNNSGPNNNWSTADANWSASSVWTQNSNGTFNGTGEIITVTTANTFNDLTFNSTGYSIADGAASLVLATDKASTITVTNAGQTATIGESLANNSAGAGALTKAGSGILTLTNTASSYSGGTIISAGAVNAGTAGSGGVGTMGTGAVSIASGASLTLNSTTTGNVTYTNSFSGAGTLVLSTAGGSASNDSTLIFQGSLASFTGAMNIIGGGKRSSSIRRQCLPPPPPSMSHPMRLPTFMASPSAVPLP